MRWHLVDTKKIVGTSMSECIGNPTFSTPRDHPSAASVLTFFKSPCANHCAVVVLALP